MESKSATRGKGGHAVWVRDELYDVLRKRAQEAGVPIASLLANLIVPPAYVTPSAREAAQWVRLADLLREGDLAGAKAIAHEVLVGLSRSHRNEVRDSATDWSG